MLDLIMAPIKNLWIIEFNVRSLKVRTNLIDDHLTVIELFLVGADLADRPTER